MLLNVEGNGSLTKVILKIAYNSQDCNRQHEVVEKVGN